MSIGVNLRVTGHTSIGGRKYQEDYFSVAYQQTENDQNLEYAFFGIYDGHGGAEASLFAKEHLMNTIVSQKQFWSENDEDVLKSIREGYIQTHYSMWREQDKWPKTSSGLPSTAGTTASIAFIRRGKIYIGHVGDSGIVLGYQKDKESPHEDDGRWVASPLTEDHKPESYAEKMRIMSCGGKVVTKSGVPRVVWNRPRIGHKGPVRRSTPIDEIPFLAVARSLGDLWSYNSAVDEFIVSPMPDVSVIEIDPKKFRCLIFGTDGLWNVISPKSAVEIVRNTEMENIRIALEGGSEWKNPSKLLVNEALERWSRSNMKADNTSVVIIMLDPPGPPKRDVLKSVKDSIQYASPEWRSASGAPGSDMFDLFDCITRGEAVPVLSQMAQRAEPSDTPSMRYLHHHHNHHHQQQHYQQHRNYHEPPQQSMHQEQYAGDHPQQDHQHLDHHHHPEQYCHPGASTSYDHDLAYRDTSFAESYNSLLDRSFENTDHSYTSMFHHAADEEGASTSAYQNRATRVEPGLETHTDDTDEEALIDYQPESDDETSGGGLVRQDSTYSLTNLQTKSERLHAAMVESERSQPHPYYHHHPQHRREEEEGCYSGGNLAIIEHFHNYHHPLPHHYGSGASSRSLHTEDAHHQYHQGMYQGLDTTHQYQHHHQDVGGHYDQHHFHHASSSYQMERYDYRHPTNNNLLACEPSCSTGTGSKLKSDSEFAYANVYNEEGTLQQPAEEIGMEEENEEAIEELVESPDVHRIQINEISSSYAGTQTNASPGLLLPSGSDGHGSGCASGDEENSASSTTQQVLVVPSFENKPRTMKKSAPSPRVITIFYETRSSRRKPRIRNATSGLTPSKTRSLLGVASFNRIATKRRKTSTATVVQTTIPSGVPSTPPNPTLTIERRILRSNGMNTRTRSYSNQPNPRVHADHQPKFVLNNNFGVSSTTLERIPATHQSTETNPLRHNSPPVCRHRKRDTIVATLVRTSEVVEKRKQTPKPAIQQRTMLLRRTTQ
ncbi:uncharacterized protein LOC131272004 [Anopheles coustani]|uniref:uncharacterized protein LOC131272004 n=1 Tax=Anopheles coustani TaxID=139045 RepID=UPI00265A4480|nr:uncharacterized protein LOC131272004 [Anopheles coustani]